MCHINGRAGYLTVEFSALNVHWIIWFCLYIYMVLHVYFNAMVPVLKTNNIKEVQYG